MRQKPNSICFRCDFGPRYGLGHLMRCIALAEEFQKQMNIQIICLTNKFDEKFFSLLQTSGMEIITFAQKTVGLEFDLTRYVPHSSNMITLFDHYDVTFEQMKVYKEKHQNLVAIDDLADRRFKVDIIINQNINSARLNYQRDSATKLLLGSQYALLRKSILEMPKRRKKGRIFMTFGGGDVFQRIKKFLYFFHEIDKKSKESLQIDFALDIKQLTLIHPLLDGLNKIKFNYITNSYDLSTVMAEADFAITAAGSTIFELTYLGIPQIAFMIEQNQAVTGEEINNKGFGVCLGDIQDAVMSDFVACFFELLKNDTMKAEMSHRGQRFIDGQGAKRVVSELMNYYSLVA